MNDNIVMIFLFTCVRSIENKAARYEMSDVHKHVGKQNDI